MKKLRLLSIILIAAVCVMAVLSGCNTTVYPNIEDISEVFAAISEIENYDCDIFYTLTGEGEEGVYSRYSSYCLKNLQLAEDASLIYFYDIQKPIDVYSIDNKVFHYNEGVLVEEMPSFIPSLPFVDGIKNLNYTASYPVTNRTAFDIDASTTINLDKLEDLFLVNDITKFTINIIADNNTKMPVSISYYLEYTYTIAESQEKYNAATQIKYVFKKINKPISIDYPEEVKTYIDKNYPSTEEEQ